MYAPAVDVAAGAAGNDVALTVGDGHTLTVTAHEITAGTPLPAKVTVLCSGACADTPTNLVRFEDSHLDTQPDDVAVVAFMPPTGTLDIPLPAGQYQVIVTHGPEYSIWPLSAPTTGFAVDLRTGDATAHAVLAKVVDTTGESGEFTQCTWKSADR